MRWKQRKRSENIEDRRHQGSARALGGGAMLLLRIIPWALRSKLGRALLGIGFVVILGAHLLGIDVLPLVNDAQTPTTGQAEPPGESELVDFVSVVLADTEQTWHDLFEQQGLEYREPTLVIFRDSVTSACGFAQAAMGPFYCGADEKLYIDLSFYQDLQERHQAPGDFAQAYVIAHEVGHHVQNILGISERVRKTQATASERDANRLSVRQELQADCFAGIWGHHATVERDLLEDGDLNEALAAAAAIGDDRLQQRSRGYVTPDSFTHGTSAQRVQWFRRGFNQGTLNVCDTFAQ